MGLSLVSVLSVLGRYKAILRDLSVPQIYKQMSFIRFHIGETGRSLQTRKKRTLKKVLASPHAWLNDLDSARVIDNYQDNIFTKTI